MVTINNKLILSLFCFTVAGGIPVIAADSSVMMDDDVDTIVVTASRIPEKKSETPANVTVITGAQIEDNRYDSVAEVLTHVNGVNLTETIPGAFATVRLNGESRVSILVDGQKVDNPQGVTSGRGVLDLAALPGVASIERIEIVKGNGSALYGSDAVGGVINIITKKANKNETTLDLSTGSWNTHNYRMTNEGTHGKWGWFVTGELAHRGYYKVNKGGETLKYEGNGYESDYNNDALTARIDQKINDSSSLRYAFSHKTYDGKIPGTVYDETTWLPEPGYNVLNRINNNWSVTYNFKENTEAPGYLRYFNNYTSTYWYCRFNVRSQGFQAQDTWKSGKHTLTAGVEWQKDSASNESAGYEDQGRTNRALYIEDIITLSKLSITPGLRLDDNSQFGFHKTPKIALNYRANDKFNAYASWGRVFSAPHLDDLYYNSYGMYGNTELKPETGYSESVGFNYKMDSKTSFNVSWFRSKMDNAIRWFSADSTTWFAKNVNSEKKHGFEVAMNKQINNAWKYELGYSYVYGQTDYGDGQGYNCDTGLSQPNGYYAGIHYAKRAWKANIQMTAGTGRNTSVYSHNSYVVWDASTSYDVNNAVTVYMKMNNITNKEYELYQDYPMAGRFFLAGVKYKF